MGILYVSGDPLNKKLTKADGDAYIQKPCDLHDLSSALRIIHDIRTKDIIPRSLFPKGFHLLEYPVSNNRIAA
ncbi:MAG: hypothetical protein WBK55_09065 [Alphaproteobacteria bacterium]